ncbi:MAG: ATP-binding protein [Chloroflexi bacterium]|nr:ATP-binding protein [Chloroflexota bacterium]
MQTLRRRNFWIVAALLAAITLLHYGSPQVRLLPFSAYPLERHAVERILFLLPIAAATFAFGQRGGLATLGMAALAMFPRVLLLSPSPADALAETAAVIVVGGFVVWAIESQAREKRLRQELSIRLQRAYDRLQTLYDSAQTVDSTLDLPSVLDRLVESTARAMGVRGCSIRLLDETGKRLNVESVFGLSESYVKKGDLVLDQNPLAREVLSGRVIAIGDVATDGRLQYPAAASAEGIRSMLSAPLIGRRGPLGLIRAYSTEPDHFTDGDASFLAAMASQGSIAIENAMTYAALGKLDEMKSRFVLTVTHELRSPVGVVTSLLRTLKDGYAGAISEEQRDIITRVQQRADLLQTLIDDLLDLAAGKSALATEERIPLKWSDTVEEVLKRFGAPAGEKNLKLSFSCECGERGAVVSATREGLDRILTNLVSNAVKYTPTGGSVSLCLRRTDGEAVLDVADTGIGIPQESLTHLFEEFYRAPNARAQHKQGTGLGLAITRDLVTRFGGRISVASKLGEGTQFTVTLPLVES